MRRVEALKHRVSFADLQRMPDNGNRYELYDGALRVVPSPFPIHQRVVRRLLEIFLDVSRYAGGEVFDAPFDIVLSDYDVVQPGVIYFGPELPEYWIVDPDAGTLEVWIQGDDRANAFRTLRSGKYESPFCAGLVVDLDSLFAGIE